MDLLTFLETLGRCGKSGGLFVAFLMLFFLLILGVGILSVTATLGIVMACWLTLGSFGAVCGLRGLLRWRQRCDDFSVEVGWIFLLFLLTTGFLDGVLLPVVGWEMRAAPLATGRSSALFGIGAGALVAVCLTLRLVWDYREESAFGERWFGVGIVALYAALLGTVLWEGAFTF